MLPRPTIGATLWRRDLFHAIKHIKTMDRETITTTETIDGVQYTEMGWHPTRDPNSYLTKKLGKILSEKIEIATTDN